MTPVEFLPACSGNSRIAGMACAECGGPPAIFVVHDDSSLSVFCSPPCAAGCGVAPWADADLVTRLSWSGDDTAPTESVPASDGTDAAGAAGFLDVSSNLVTAPGPVSARGHPFW